MLLPLLFAVLSTTAATDTITPNQMRVAAGTLRNGVLTLELEAREGRWYPDGPQEMARTVASFGEPGKPLLNPGPLVRVPRGTEVRIRVHNKLTMPLKMFGLGSKRGLDEVPVEIAAGASHSFGFNASQAGLFYYAGQTGKGLVLDRDMYDSQLNGVIAVDEPDAIRNDRLFLISWWGSIDSTKVSGLMEGATITINGLSWPHTERIQAVQNEAEHWRWVNVTSSVHPLHLHGFYFRVDGTGNGSTFTSFAPEQRQMAVTEIVAPGGSMAMTWTPQRPGNWVLHCHFAGHIATMSDLNKDRRMPDKAIMHTDHHKKMMEAMVIGIHVEPRGEMKASGRAPRPLRLVARSRAKVYGEYVGYAYSTDENAPFDMPGPVLVLEKDEPVAINIVNKTHEPAAVHWHGIELESFPDGVPNFSGAGNTLLRPIPAGDSLVVRFTPPRAGTFMYHSHMNEFQQISSGMYGAIVVLPPGEKYDPETDRIMLLSDNGPLVDLIRGPFPAAMLNGRLRPELKELRAGQTYRLRVINIRSDTRARLEVLRDGKPVQWKFVARDGADLPAPQISVQDAILISGPGQIFDYEFTPETAGELTVRYGPAKVSQTTPDNEVKWTVK